MLAGRLPIKMHEMLIKILFVCMSSLTAWLLPGQCQPVLERAARRHRVGIIWPTTSANKYHSGLLQSAARNVEHNIPAGIHICLGRCVCGCLCESCFTSAQGGALILKLMFVLLMHTPRAVTIIIIHTDLERDIP